MTRIDRLGDLVERRGRLVVHARYLTEIAAGRHPAPISCPDEFRAALDALVNRVREGRWYSSGAPRRHPIELDFARRPAASRVARPNGSSPALRGAAFECARALWNVALSETVARKAALDPAAQWSSTEDATWRHWTVPAPRSPDQGWKLHVSATPTSAPLVLERCADVLLAHRATFKHAATIEVATMLTSRNVDRSQGGKFITVYPESAEEARRLAERLHRATSGLTGPRILSDRPYEAGSLVHYRYGVFRRRETLTNDGTYDDRLQRPDGTRVEDPRRPWFSPPDWVEPLLPVAATPSSRSSGPMRLAGRYLVRQAIRHSYRGSVYRATDERTGGAVILKQARPHTAGDLSGGDATDALRVEARNLTRLGDLGPALVDLFEDQRHLFLVQSAIPGTTLFDHLAARPLTAASTPHVRRLIGAVCGVLQEVHRRGLVCRDLSPGNVMIGPEGELRLIDAELISEPGELVANAHTPGFGAPEHVGGPAWSCQYAPASDLYALGALCYFIATAAAPPVCVAGDAAATLAARWRVAIEAVPDDRPAGLTRLILALTQFDPRRRPALASVLDTIASDAFWSPPGVDRRRASGSAASASGAEPVDEEHDAAARLMARLVPDGTRYLLESWRGPDAHRLANVSPAGALTDACNVHHGAGGVLGYLCRVRPSVVGVDPTRAVRGLAEWIDERLTRRSDLLPGLYFGAAGAAWAQHSAARRLNDERLSRRAEQHLLRMPTRWPNPDVYHGAAGVGLALCEAWSHRRDDRLAQHIADCADGITAQARDDATGVSWQVEEQFDSRLRGTMQYGFAHGVAGIGHFLLMAGIVTGRAEYVSLAAAAGDTLVRAAEPCDVGLRWRSDVRADAARHANFHYYLCNGSAGVGAFLVRLWRATGRAAYRATAEGAAAAAHGVRWHSPMSMCCGLAGCGQLLLDMADFVDEKYAAMAREAASCLVVRAVVRDGRTLVADLPNGGVSVDYNAGLAGVLDFVERLRARAPRLWMPDGLLEPAGRRPTDSSGSAPERASPIRIAADAC